MVVRFGQTDEQAPPIVDQRNHPGEQPTALQIMRGEAALAPVIFQLVVATFTIRPISI
jgi:hypothetical protein